jgi:signal transduction histidine kinase
MMAAVPKLSITRTPSQALAAGSIGIVVVTVVMLPFNDSVNKAAPALLLLVPVIGAGAPNGGQIEVVVRGGTLLRVEVSDHGSGLSPDVRSRLLEPFATASGSSSSGVGLAICRSIVEAHGGTIAASDTPGGGARFIVEVPVRA